MTTLLKKTSWQLSFVAIALLAITGCADHDSRKPSPQYGHSKFGYEGTSDASFAAAGSADAANATSTNNATPPPADNTPPATNPFLSPTPQPTNSSRDLPYGTPVPGKPGFVTSPHSPSAGYVDVRGFPPGTEVKDPYSGKVFLVP